MTVENNDGRRSLVDLMEQTALIMAESKMLMITGMVRVDRLMRVAVVAALVAVVVAMFAVYESGGSCG